MELAKQDSKEVVQIEVIVEEETKEKAKEADEEETEQDSLIGELNEEEKKKDQIGKDKSTGESKITHRKRQMKR